MNIIVFGMGYVGLVIGVSLVDVGYNVLCMDVDVVKIELLKKGIVIIYEFGLDVVVQCCFEDGILNFLSFMEEVVVYGELIFIVVGMFLDEDGFVDL